jgi:multiple sugar transport system substrate-binding protein
MDVEKMRRGVAGRGTVFDGRKRAMAAAFVLLASVTAACGGSGGSGVATLNWYINPDNGGQKELAAKCSAASNGAYRISTSVLPNDATSQREQLVRRLAAKDSSIDLMSLDPPFIPEFAEAGFLRPYSEAEAQELTAGALSGPIESGTWNGKLMGAPFWANTQLLWFRKSVAQAAGINPARDPVTWSQIIDLASSAGKTVEVQGNLYEGYMVLISALISSAGGQILQNPEAGKNVTPSIDSDAGRKAAAVIQQLGRSKAADPALSTSDEEAARAAFQGARGGFMVNWAYVYGAAQEAVAAGTLDKAVLDDIGWARYPRVDAGTPSRPPLGGINLGIGAFGKHKNEALQAVRCITSLESQTQYMLKSKNPGARAAVYDNPEVRTVFPMADDLRASLAEGAPRPRTPYYTDVSTAVQRTFHPPAAVDPNRTPAKAGKLIVDVLKDKVLL